MTSCSKSNLNLLLLLCSVDNSYQIKRLASKYFQLITRIMQNLIVNLLRINHLFKDHLVSIHLNISRHYLIKKTRNKMKKYQRDLRNLLRNQYSRKIKETKRIIKMKNLLKKKKKMKKVRKRNLEIQISIQRKEYYKILILLEVIKCLKISLPILALEDKDPSLRIFSFSLF